MAISQLYPDTMPSLGLNFSSGRALDPRITFTRASTGTFVGSNGLIQTALTDQPRVTYDPVTKQCLGLLVEEARTNSIRNNTMVGAVAGTPGTSPTNWSGPGTAAGLTATLVGTGVQNGVNYIDYRVSGTPTNTNLALNLGFEGLSSIAASNGQTWTISGYSAIVGGSLTNIASVRWSLGPRDASTYLAFLQSGEINRTSALVRTSFTATIASVGTLYIQPSLWIYHAGVGLPVDVTIRIGLPQLELGAFATSPILTSGSAATRAVDVATITGANFSWWYRQDEGTLFVRSIPVNTAGNGIVGFDDSTSAERWRVGHSGTTTAVLTMVDDSSVTATPASPVNSWSLNTAGSAAAAIQLNNTNVAANGLLGTLDTSCTLPTVTQMTIGTAQAISPNNGPIAHIIYYPQRLSDTYLQQLTK